VLIWRENNATVEKLGSNAVEIAVDERTSVQAVIVVFDPCQYTKQLVISNKRWLGLMNIHDMKKSKPDQLPLRALSP